MSDRAGEAAIDIRISKWTAQLRADALLIPIAVADGKVRTRMLARLPKALAPRLSELVSHYHGAKRPGAIEATVLPDGSPFRRLALVCVGEEGKVKPGDVRAAAGAAAEWCARQACRSAAVDGDALQLAAGKDAAGQWVEATELSGYRFTRLKSKKPNEQGRPIRSLALASSMASAAMRNAVQQAHAVAVCTNLARELGHEPPNVINPVTLAARIRGIARSAGLRCTVLDERQLAARKMGAFLAVAAGSASPARMIVLEHRGGGKSRPIALVGKAVTYDTGGYSIKPAASMMEMKYDKCGGMAVIGAMVAAARLKLKVNLVGIIGAAENMISSNAFRPGDIVTASNGTTIEVNNTDAEGRLVLADCLVYACRQFKPAGIIDLATLTGAITSALGNACGGLYTHDDKLAEALIQAGERTDERLWRMPLWTVYRDQIVGNDSDLKNVGGPSGGANVAAAFLREFVDAKTPWAHLDIAGVSRTDKALAYCPIGATGFGVRLLVDYLDKLTRNG